MKFFLRKDATIYSMDKGKPQITPIADFIAEAAKRGGFWKRGFKSVPGFAMAGYHKS